MNATSGGVVSGADVGGAVLSLTGAAEGGSATPSDVGTLGAAVAVSNGVAIATEGSSSALADAARTGGTRPTFPTIRYRLTSDARTVATANRVSCERQSTLPSRDRT